MPEARLIIRAICLYLHIHQPFRYREYSIFDVGNSTNYFVDTPEGRQSNERIFKKVAEKSYTPMLTLLEKLLKTHPDFKFSLSITGTWLEQATSWTPSLITKLKRLVATGRVEILSETYYHSLAFFYNQTEFEAEVEEHTRAIQKLFGVTPQVFRNTELAYTDSLAHWAESHGYVGILAEGWDKILQGKSPGHVYRPLGCKNLRLLLKNYRLSDDIAFRFGSRAWEEWPLTVAKYQRWVEDACLTGPLVNLFMDFETFGEHQWSDTGIFDFFAQFVKSWLKGYGNRFVTVSEACRLERPRSTVSAPTVVTWADSERDLSAWNSNSMQQSAINHLYGLRSKILQSEDKSLIHAWRLLSTSDHSYSMCTKYWHDGDVHAYFSAYASPFESFVYYSNILRDLEYRLSSLKPSRKHIITHFSEKNRLYKPQTLRYNRQCK